MWLHIPKDPPSLENDRQKKKSLNVISNMATDIICSVSSHFCVHTILKARRTKLPPVSGVFVMLFPLAVAGGAIGVSEDLHDRVIKTLCMIGNTLGSK